MRFSTGIPGVAGRVSTTSGYIATDVKRIEKG